MKQYAEKKLRELTMKGATFQKLMDLGEKLLGNPISCSDSSFHHRALSTNYPIKDIEERAHYRSVTSAEEYYKFTIFPYKNVSDNKPFVLLTPGARRRLICKCYISGMHVGHLAVPECDTQLEEMDYELISLISDACAICYVMENSAYDLANSSDPEQAIFEALINDGFKNEESFRLRARHYFFDRELNYCVAVVKYSTEYAEATPEMLRYCVRRFGGHGWVLNLSGDIVMLFAWDKTLSVYDRFASEAEGMCADYSMTVFLSDVYTQPLDTKRQLANALSVDALLPHVANKVYFYNDFKIERAIRTLFDGEWSESDLCLSQYKVLAEQDAKNGTELARTLAEYVACGRSLTKTAERLFIHKNTIIYRLKKITALTGLDADSPETTLGILFSRKVLDQTERRARK